MEWGQMENLQLISHIKWEEATTTCLSRADNLRQDEEDGAKFHNITQISQQYPDFPRLHNFDRVS